MEGLPSAPARVVLALMAVASALTAFAVTAHV